MEKRRGKTNKPFSWSHSWSISGFLFLLATFPTFTRTVLMFTNSLSLYGLVSYLFSPEIYQRSQFQLSDLLLSHCPLSQLTFMTLPYTWSSSLKSCWCSSWFFLFLKTPGSSAFFFTSDTGGLSKDWGNLIYNPGFSFGLLAQDFQISFCPLLSFRWAFPMPGKHLLLVALSSWYLQSNVPFFLCLILPFLLPISLSVMYRQVWKTSGALYQKLISMGDPRTSWDLVIKKQNKNRPSGLAQWNILLLVGVGWF